MNIDYFKTHQPLPIDCQTVYGLTIPLIELDGQWFVIYERRAKAMRRQPGEISLPGGKLERNETARQAALRETVEELGIAAQHIEIIGEMDYLATPFGECLFPFVVVLHDLKRTDFQINHAEVDDLLFVKLASLRRQQVERHTVSLRYQFSDDFPFDKIQRGRDYQWRPASYPIYFYQLEDDILWGITAKITKRFLSYLTC